MSEVSPRASAIPRPESLPFALQDGEQVMLFCRRHWVFLWPMLAFRIAAGLLPFGALIWVTAITTGLGSTLGKVLLVVGVIWLIYWAVRAFFGWYAYMHDIWAVTNQRIIDGTRPNFFNRHLASADLTDVQDIAVEQNGILATALHFGSIRCQTAGEQPNFVLSGIPGPANVLTLLDAARDAARRESLRGMGRGLR